MTRRLLVFLFSILLLFSFLFGFQIGRLQSTPASTSENRDAVRGSGSGAPSDTVEPSSSKEEKPADLVDLKIFWDVWNRLHEKYVDSSVLIPKELVYGAIRGMVASLEDPYTVYMTPEETIEFQNSLDGTLEGIGAELTVKEKLLSIVSIIQGSPAEKAGLQPNDVILEINQQTAADMTIYQAITKIRGKRGTKVTLLILRQTDGPKPFEVTLTRDKIDLDSVVMEEKGNGIFYLAIHQFTDRTKNEFQEMIQKILLKEPKGFILDLRSNGGGYLDIAVDILSAFLSGKKEAVKIQRRSPTPDDVIFVDNSAQLADIPLVVLVNDASASASEIVAGAIQDHKRGVVIGERTFGKGSVQEVESLPDSSSLRITIAKWVTPRGRSIDEVGIAPDIEISLSEEDLKKGVDPQLEKAVFYLQDLK